MSGLENFFVKKQNKSSTSSFFCMDTINVNSGEKNGLKRHLEHKFPLLK